MSNLANPTVINGQAGSYQGNNIGQSGDLSNWFFWIAPASGPVFFSTRSTISPGPPIVGTDFKTKIAIYSGPINPVGVTLAQLTIVGYLSGGNEPNGFGYVNGAEAAFNASTIVGGSYYIQVDSRTGQTGHFELRWGIFYQEFLGACDNCSPLNISLCKVGGTNITGLGFFSFGTHPAGRYTIVVCGAPSNIGCYLLFSGDYEIVSQAGNVGLGYWNVLGLAYGAFEAEQSYPAGSLVDINYGNAGPYACELYLCIQTTPITNPDASNAYFQQNSPPAGYHLSGGVWVDGSNNTVHFLDATVEFPSGSWAQRTVINGGSQPALYQAVQDVPALRPGLAPAYWSGNGYANCFLIGTCETFSINHTGGAIGVYMPTAPAQNIGLSLLIFDIFGLVKVSLSTSPPANLGALGGGNYKYGVNIDFFNTNNTFGTGQFFVEVLAINGIVPYHIVGVNDVGVQVPIGVAPSQTATLEFAFQSTNTDSLSVTVGVYDFTGALLGTHVILVSSGPVLSIFGGWTGGQCASTFGRAPLQFTITNHGIIPASGVNLLLSGYSFSQKLFFDPCQGPTSSPMNYPLANVGPDVPLVFNTAMTDSLAGTFGTAIVSSISATFPPYSFAGAHT